MAHKKGISKKEQRRAFNDYDFGHGQHVGHRENRASRRKNRYQEDYFDGDEE